MQGIKAVILLVCSTIIGLGIFAGGFAIGKGIYFSRIFNRTITVKGLAERDIKSDLGIWEINYREVGANLTDLNQRVEKDQAQVIQFLKINGFSPAELAVQPLKVEDRLANVYQTQNSTPDRYIVTSGVRVRSARVELIQKTSQLTGTLLQQGIPITFDSAIINPNPSYYLTKLDEIRPSMLADATKSARLVAEQFAKDTDTELKDIQRASQGVFQVMSRDTSTMNTDWSSNQNALGSIDKRVRLVTTIDYRLK